jgi:hypothetical protein
MLNYKGACVLSIYARDDDFNVSYILETASGVICYPFICIYSFFKLLYPYLLCGRLSGFIEYILTVVGKY